MRDYFAAGPCSSRPCGWDPGMQLARITGSGDRDDDL